MDQKHVTRRSFLRSLGAVAAGVSLGLKLNFGQPEMFKEQLGAAGGLLPDLTNVIFNISPIETPFLSMMGRVEANPTFHEWQTDTLYEYDPDLHAAISAFTDDIPAVKK